MSYYLTCLSHITLPVLHIRNDAHAVAEFNNWFGDLVDNVIVAGAPVRCFTAILKDHHWFPLELDFRPDSTSAATTPDMRHEVQQWFDYIVGANVIQVDQQVVDSRFPADCGFQTIAWIQSRGHSSPTVTSMSSAQAEGWRLTFIRYLQDTGLDQEVKQVSVGGVSNDQQLMQALQELIVQHGVNQARASGCAQHLLHTIGAAQIKSILGSPRPWADLKTHANQHSIKIVTASELKEAIDQRLQSGKPFGRKENKKKERVRQPPVRLTADQVDIPASVFQVDGQPVPQITQHQMQTSDVGIMVLNVEDALPYLQLTAPINKTAMAIIVLDHQDERLPDKRELIKFPANCVGTNEAMLITAAIFQIGQKKAERPKLQACIRVEETELLVIRALVYRDQYQGEWRQFADHPVKSLLNENELAQHRDAVHDVWDRQFLDLRYQRCKPSEAELFTVTLRMNKASAMQIMESNALNGIFYEQRTPNGRKPAEEYEVVWIPKKSLNELVLMKQTSPHPAAIARAGMRYGLRVLRTHAKATHDTFRPDLEYIPNEDMQMYRIGPMPFGTTRTSLSKVFQKWNWIARPGQPVGQDKEHTGMFWSAMSHQAPSHWVYPCEHGDILISRLPSKRDHKPASAIANASIEASKHTMQHLTGKANRDEGRQDPWLKSDPWAPNGTQAKTVSPHQMAAIEASVEKRVIQAIRPQMYRLDDDEEMPNAAFEQKVAELETQMQSIHANMQQFQQFQNNVHQFQQQQVAQNQQMTQQIQGVQHQVEMQQKNIGSMLDEKMREQMDRIESLFSKRAKVMTHE